MIRRQRTQDLRHPHRKPAVAAPPVIGNLRPVKKQPIGLLQFVQICRHFVGRAVGVFRILGGPVGLNLERTDHEHVIHPPAGFAGEPVGGADPLLIGNAQAEIQIFLPAVHQVDFQRHHAEHMGIHMIIARDQGVALGRKNIVVAAHQLFFQGRIANRIRKTQAAKSGADLRVNDVAHRFVDGMFPRQEILRDFFADGPGIGVGGQVLEGGHRGAFTGITSGPAAVQQEDQQEQGQGGKNGFVHAPFVNCHPEVCRMQKPSNPGCREPLANAPPQMLLVRRLVAPPRDQPLHRIQQFQPVLEGWLRHRLPRVKPLGPMVEPPLAADVLNINLQLGSVFGHPFPTDFSFGHWVLN